MDIDVTRDAWPRRAVVAVVYDLGSAGPLEIASAARGICDLIWVLPDSAHARAVRPLLASAGRIIDVSDIPDLDGPAAQAIADDLRPCSGLVTFSERVLPAAAWLGRLASTWWLRAETVRALTEKDKQRQALAMAGLDDTRFARIDGAAGLLDAVDAVGTPAMLKPVRSWGSRGARAIPSRASAKDLLQDPNARARLEREPYIVEAFLEGPGRLGPVVADYVSVECLSVEPGHHVCVGISGKFPMLSGFLETGSVFPARLAGEVAAGIESLACSALTALGVERGLSHIEIKLTNRGPRIIEVNGRLGGEICELVQAANDLNLIRECLKQAAGLPVITAPPVPSGVSFEIGIPAPLGARAVGPVQGVERVRAEAPEIRRLEVRIREGMPIDPDVPGAYVVAVKGVAQTHERVYEVRTFLMDTIQFDAL